MFSENTYIIAEAGINHNGEFKIAEELVREAAATGADAVKFQIWDANELSSDPDFVEDLRSWELEPNEWAELNSIANEEGIDFSASVFDRDSVDLLSELDPKFIKIASGDLTHTPLVDYVASKQTPVVMSTGMATLEEVATAVATVRGYHDELSLLHCISSYPVSIDDLNLRSMDVLRDAFGLSVGFSDHTTGTFASPLAVGRGAEVVERHFTLDSTMEGPDQELSLEPAEFSELVDRVRAAERSKGNREVRTQPAEREAKTAMRRGLTARTTIEQGERFTEENVKVARPAAGIAPGHYELVVGRRASQMLSSDDPISWDDVE